MDVLQATYILPARLTEGSDVADLASYLNGLPVDEIIVADGSSAQLFHAFDRLLDRRIHHIPPSVSIRANNGKVRNVLSALAIASHDRVVIADDDVRYTPQSLSEAICALDDADIVRPQNYFDPLPWHALLDTGRTLLNRALDGDWPGTLAVRRSAIPNGYNGDVLFENYELVRTVRARGGRERIARDIYVARRPPTSRHFFSQRIRQAYDEFARPVRLAVALAIAPALIGCAFTGKWRIPAAGLGCILVAAAYGRLRDGGARVFPAAAIAAAPLWVCERAICSWLAVYERVRFGGVRYAGAVLRDAATPGNDRRRWAA